MQKLPFLFLASALLAACSQQQPEPPVSAPDPAVNADVISEQRSTAGVNLPGGVYLTTPLHLRSDRTRQNDAGVKRRRVVYELLEVGPEDAYQAVSVDFERAGYKETRRKKTRGGNTAVTYRKDKTVNVLFHAKPPKRPANPSAKSSLAVAWDE